MSTPHTALDMAVQGPNQKHAEDIANTISVKLDGMLLKVLSIFLLVKCILVLIYFSRL